MSRWTVDRTDPDWPDLGFADRSIVLDADVLWDAFPDLGRAEVEQAITALAALVPPTAGEIDAHHAAGGHLKMWLAHDWEEPEEGGQRWVRVHESLMAELLATLRRSDPNTPQPGFRLVPLDGEG